MTHYYAAINQYATPSSIGFANTWNVIVFDSRKARDAYVEAADDLATRAITKREISSYVDAPKPFSGNRRAIECASISPLKDDPEGYVGFVTVVNSYEVDCYPNGYRYL